jgi:hypothetical protein
MPLATPLAITLACIRAALDSPGRLTCRWEVAATLNIALQGVALFLMSPFTSETIRPGLHRP